MRKFVFIHIWGLILLIICFISFPFVCSNNDVHVYAQQYTIEIDSTSKTVQRGENAIFNWKISNDARVYKYEFFVSESNSEFSEDQFTLMSGESKEITQVLHPIENNSEFVIYHVVWKVKELLGPGETDTSYFSGTLQVVVLNDSENGRLNDNIIANNKENNENFFYSQNFLIILFIVLIAIPIIYYYFKK